MCKELIHAQIVQAATKWKRLALKQFGMKVNGTWELVITEEECNLDFLTDVVKKYGK